MDLFGKKSLKDKYSQSERERQNLNNHVISLEKNLFQSYKERDDQSYELQKKQEELDQIKKENADHGYKNQILQQSLYQSKRETQLKFNQLQTTKNELDQIKKEKEEVSFDFDYQEEKLEKGLAELDATKKDAEADIRRAISLKDKKGMNTAAQNLKLIDNQKLYMHNVHLDNKTIKIQVMIDGHKNVVQENTEAMTKVINKLNDSEKAASRSSTTEEYKKAKDKLKACQQIDDYYMQSTYDDLQSEDDEEINNIIKRYSEEQDIELNERLPYVVNEELGVKAKRKTKTDIDALMEKISLK